MAVLNPTVLCSCSGVPVSEISKVAGFCKQQFSTLGSPDALTYLNECAVSFQGEGGGPGFERPGRYRSWIHGSLPAALDLISIDNCEHYPEQDIVLSCARRDGAESRIAGFGRVRVRP